MSTPSGTLATIATSIRRPASSARNCSSRSRRSSGDGGCGRDTGGAHGLVGRRALVARFGRLAEQVQQVGDACAEHDEVDHHEGDQRGRNPRRRHGAEAALGLVDDGIRRAAGAAGTPEKHHATMTRAWVELVAHHAAQDQDGPADFAAFAARHPGLLDKGLLTRFYRPETLAGTAARRGWVEPDLRPFPWT